MRFIEEYRDPDAVKLFAQNITRLVTKPWTIMEICGGQTHAIIKYGIDQLLPDLITLVHGPGCPVCVTPVEMIDKAIQIASLKNVVFCSFGDMLRVPGTNTDLLAVKASGGDVRIVYSPMDALQIAKNNPSMEVVFFAIGFETTAPANAMAVFQASKQNIKNFSVLVSQIIVPPAIEAILSSPKNQVQGFLAAGHVCTVMGYKEYVPIAEKYRVPVVVTGFEPVDILQGIYMCIKQLEENRAVTENQYVRSVRIEGNITAQHIIREVFRIVTRNWRGIGEIPGSGLALNDAFSEFDAEQRFNFIKEEKTISSQTACISGLILQGVKKPFECAEFRTNCTPEHPIGATMVSSEGACSIYYRFKASKSLNSE
ncbi:MAG: hydrogenase formation protein HypD [Candidatus Schekmanbacteria bacterium RBG_13_48_7]|uniref:Hydrogenase formation protein HypD n=1 Tax=Candidatus Schekmanbacteria bacterium RBG_13_48_7 TaxID=1817878 RepID=A0A1F7S934_9BACT|nr:MAG: hydrogenase formation protein HypD [Candidatus Schekmanbacteria bacterium RBG_13_48_7]